MEDRTNAVLEEISRRWEHLTLADDFVFCKVMLDEGLCRDVLEAILHVPIDHVEYVGQQETVDITPRSKGVRLDVYVRDGTGTVYDVEMQAANTHELPRRARYYQSLMTLRQLEAGVRYRSLNDAYVIFVCGFDLFGQGRRVYSFENRCVEDGALALRDGARTVFLSATSPEDPRVDSRVNEFLDYIASGQVSGEFSARLDEAVDRVLDSSEWRLEYMMLAVRDQLNVDKGRQIGVQLGLEQGRAEGLAKGLEQGKAEGLAKGLEQGKAEGLAKGRAEGKAEGEERLGRLIGALLASGRADDAARAAADSSVRERLYRELGVL